MTNFHMRSFLPRSTPDDRRPVRAVWMWALLAALLIGNAFFLHYNAFRIFNFFDMGSFMDGGWRVATGQRPYVDFLYHAGPVHLWLHAVFFTLLGFGKTAVWAHLVTMHSLVIVAVFGMLWRRVPDGITLLVTALTVPSFYWMISHPWLDGNAHVWGVLAVAWLSRRLPFTAAREAETAGWLTGCLAVLSLMTKTNIGGAYGLAFGVVFLATPHFRGPVWKGYVLGAAVTVGFILLLVGRPDLLWEQASVHTRVVGFRFRQLFEVHNWFVNFYWLPWLVVLAVAGPLYRTRRCLIVLFFGVTLVGIFSVLTGKIVTPANHFLWGPQMALAFLVLQTTHEVNLSKRWRTGVRMAQAIMIVTAVGLTGLGVRDGWQLRAWFRLAGPTDQAYYLLQEGPLAGWRTHPWEGRPIDGMVRYLRENSPADERILVLADMYILNAVLGRESYPGVPIVFWKQQIPAKGRQAAAVRQRIVQYPPAWIVIHANSFEHEIAHLRLENEIKGRYIPVRRFGPYFLLRRRSDAPQGETNDF